MSILLVRHGKAAPLDEGDYDQLSALGHEQATALGEHWVRAGVQIAVAFVGPRRRHLRTHDAVAAVYERHGLAWPTPTPLPELDEHDGLALVRKLLPREPESVGASPMSSPAHTPSRTEVLANFKQLTRAWVRGTVSAPGVEPWSEFRARAARGRAILESAAAEHKGSKRSIAAFTSAGAVAAIVGDVLGVGSESTVLELSWSLHNGSVSTLAASDAGLMMANFNVTAHLTDPRLLTHV